MYANNQKSVVNNVTIKFPHYETSKKHFMLSYILLLGIILIIGMILYLATYSQVRSGIHQQNRQALSSSVSEMEDTLELMNAVARQVSANSSFTALAQLSGSENPEFYYQAFAAQTSLKSLTPAIEILLPAENSFVYMANSNYIVSSSRFVKFDQYVLNEAIYGISAEELSQLILDQEFWNRFIPINHNQDSGNYLYVCPLSTFDLGVQNSRAVMCYEFRLDDLTRIFSNMNFYSTGYLAVFDRKGNLLFQLSPHADAASYSALNNLNQNNGIAHYTSDNGEKKLVTCAVSSYNGWQYFWVQPETQAYYSIASYQQFFTLITIAALATGGIIAAVSTTRSSKRYTQLSNELSIKDDINSSLNQLVEKQKPVVIESYMRRIMEGSVTTNDEMQYIINELSLDRPEMKYHVLYTEVSSSEQLNVHADDMELCIQNYDTLVREALTRYYPDTGYIYKPSDRAFAILIASEKSTPYEQIISHDREVFIALHNELLTNYGILIRGGFGGRNGLISYTWKSYQQAKDAKSITTADKYILSHIDFIHSTDVYYFPESLSIQLSGFISTGNKDQVNELFKLIRNENTVKRSLSYTQQRWLISDVRSTLFKKRHNISVEELDNDRLKILDMVDRQFEGEMSLTSLNAIALELCDVCGATSEGNELILKIQEYITHNYSDPNLGLTKISEEFGISENYFSYLFKKEVSENFSTYLERLRMAKAKELIQDSNTSLSTLYQYLGYNNAASFRRAFKKNFGVSPKEMRDNINAK